MHVRVAVLTEWPLVSALLAQRLFLGSQAASGWLPFLDQGLAYVRLADASDATLGPVEVMGFDLAMHRAKIVELPFYDAGKLVARGLEAPKV